MQQPEQDKMYIRREWLNGSVLKEELLCGICASVKYEYESDVTGSITYEVCNDFFVPVVCECDEHEQWLVEYQQHDFCGWYDNDENDPRVINQQLA
jgi:hypothetical protein